MPKSNRSESSRSPRRSTADSGRGQSPDPDQPAAEPAEPAEPAAQTDPAESTDPAEQTEPRNRAERRAQRKGRRPNLPPGDKGPSGGHHHDPVLIPRRSGRRGNR